MASDQGFGALLRELRRRAGLTQEELAVRAAIGVRTVRDLERGRAARPQRTTADLLARALGLAGADHDGFLAAARSRPAGTPFLRSAPTDDLIGRDTDIAELTASLADPAGPRGVTLVGAAGVGKTSLAAVVARRLAGAYPGGVAGVAVADGVTAAELTGGLLAGFGVSRPEELAGPGAARVAEPGGAPVLLFVDALDRAPSVAAEVLAELLAEVPQLRFLATGRAAAGLDGERVRTVLPLAMPPGGSVTGTVGELMTYPAIGLFLERLGRVRRSHLAPDELVPLVALVRRLGGVPLAIELAAARGRVLTVPEILASYAEAPVTHPASAEPGVIALPVVVGETYRLLAPAEQRALRLLATFRQRWSRESAEALLTTSDNPGGEVVHLLDRLVALGLLNVSGDPGVRFRLPSAVRDYALARAAVEGELADDRFRHAGAPAGRPAAEADMP
ncbi:Disease resistance protein RPS5 [Actinoplanes sp. SE50]|uniref:ATP-binding protein n=1 Tax=unclassified Actinoplanes TaxID=2626549 RepID=UPI00023ECF7F|nr:MULTISPECIES: helix-turn-helix domain-containing protein [unclassified Actinoplanes]AEV81049.1 Disease resistance protein RPS5 [Actinoplanes sp. SE50/110]ATO79450.1 Disease resistance protein RPS5 [Actinoplanes sp. SE50]SLL96850.1 Transcriptional Regulator Xre family [Actinoplanes sp. SE50/110]